MTTTNCNFREDITRAELGEVLTYDILTTSGYEVEDVRYDKEYQKKDIDFIVNNEYTDQHMAVEVKTDYLTASTGNICVELSSSEKKDGWFNTTESTHLFFCDATNKIIHCVRTEELRQLYNRNNYRTIEQNNIDNGYTKTAIIALIPVADISKTNHYVLLEQS